MSHHFDVVCIGASVGALAAAALLARRTFRVLVIGEGYTPALYTHDDVPLLRRAPAPVGLETQLFRQVLAELGLSALWQRRAEALEPMFQLHWPGGALRVPASFAQLERELLHAVPHERAALSALYLALAELNGEMDECMMHSEKLLARGWLARVRRERLRASLVRVLDKVPRLPEHPLGHALSALIGFAAPLSPLPELAAARLHGSWTRGLSRLPGGEDALVQLLLDRIRSSGGSVQLDSQVLAIQNERRRAVSLTLDDARPALRLAHLLSSVPVRALLRKLPHYTPSARALSGLQLATAERVRVTVGCTARRDAAPADWAEEMLIWSPSHRPLRLHLRRDDQHAMLALEAELLPAELPEAREQLLSQFLQFAPSWQNELLAVDCVYDDAPLWRYQRGVRQLVPRSEVREAPRAQPALPVFTAWSDDLWAGERLDGVLHNAMIVGPTAMPALGLEGELLAARWAAQRITRSDAQREKMWRGMWGGLELDA